MTRAYAIALGAGTQVFTLGIGLGILGTTEVTTAAFQATACVINLAVAEWFLRRPTRHANARTSVAQAASRSASGGKRPANSRSTRP
jgi:hypothetical protein